MCEVNIVKLHCSPLHILPWTTFFFFRFAINLREKILNSVKFMVWVHNTSFTVDNTIHFFFIKKKYFLFLLFLFFKNNLNLSYIYIYINIPSFFYVI
jgi:hypothetical protein